MLLLLHNCILIDEWNFPRIQLTTDNISFKPLSEKKKNQNQAVQWGWKWYMTISPRDAPGIMFSIQYKDQQESSALSDPYIKTQMKLLVLEPSLFCILFHCLLDF